MALTYIILQYQTVPVNHAQTLLIRACETESQLSSSRISADKSQADKSDNLYQVGFAALVDGVFRLNYFRASSIIEFALSTTDASRLARYIWVVDSESCPIPSLMTLTGIPLALAAEAQLWRATYIVSGILIESISAIVLSR